MTDTMIDRMAKAMRKNATGREDGWAEEVGNAYAALEAINVRPTKAMFESVPGIEFRGVAWITMIRAALSEGSSLDRSSKGEEE